MEVGGEISDIYIHGIGDSTELKWYRVQFPTADLVKRRGDTVEIPPKTISPVARLCQTSHGSDGSWDVIGNDIYWVGGFNSDTRGVTLCNELLRHNVNDDAADLSSWKVVSSSIRLPSKSRFLAAVGTKKLCVVAGEDYRPAFPSSSDVDDTWRHCGEIFDLEENTWTYLPADYKLFSDYDTSKEVAVVGGGGDQEPTRLVFYSCRTGSTLFLDVPRGQVDGPVTRANFNMWQDPSNEPGPGIRSLVFVTEFVRPVFTNNTFYWLTPQLHLLGFDIVDQAWLLSPTLEATFPSLIDCPYPFLRDSPCPLPRDRPYPILVGLQKGRLLAIISPALGELMVASLTVTRAANFLSVSVDLVQRLFLDDDSFMPIDGKAIHGVYHFPEGGEFGLESLSQTIPPDNRLISEIALENDELTKALSVESSECSRQEIWLEEDEVIGFDEEADSVIRRLNEGTTDLDVIAVVGMPGLGKTTLARKIYEDPKINYNFFRRIWAYVGKNYKLKEVLLNILKEFTRTTTTEYEVMAVNELVMKISKFISEGGKYLIVLDDVWAPEVVDSVMRVFPRNNKGHRIMITTREGHIGRYADAHPHLLKFLSDEESFQLLENRVFRRNAGKCPEELVPHGKSIAKQCGGVPLAVVVIAGALKGRMDQSEWKMVVDNVGHHLIYQDDPNSCLKLVEMSYGHLPKDMKKCFLYCGVFKQDFEIPAWKLIRLWISEGLINSKLSASPEIIAEQYLNDLVNRNLVIVRRKRADGQVKTCQLHNMLHQFCKVMAKNRGLFQEVREKTDQTGLDIPDLDSSRRLCVQPSILEEFISKIKGSSALDHIESFLCFSTPQMWSEKLRNNGDLLKAFPLVRVLDIESLKFNFSNDFQELLYLRYIAISCDNKTLPAFFGKFWNLQTLVLNSEQSTIEIKAEIWNLLQLRHLHTNVPAKLSSPGTQTADEPSNLQTLSKVAPESCREDVLARACNLREVTVQGPMAGFFDTKKGEFNNFKKLKCLEKLKLLNDIDSSMPLQLPPAFFGFLHKLKKLTMSNTRFAWSDANKLGQLECLEVLKLKRNAFVGTTWNSDGFSQLKVLWIERADFETWKASNRSFQRLKRLVLIFCEKLEAVPSELAGVNSLEEMTLVNPKNANQSAKQIWGKDTSFRDFQIQTHYIFPGNS